MRDQYIKMRKSNQFNLNWFYFFYVSQFESLPKTRMVIVKDNLGNPIINEHEGIQIAPGVMEFKFRMKEIESQMISQNDFLQNFALVFQLYTDDILDVLDKHFNISKLIINDPEGKHPLHRNKEGKVTYIA